MFLRAITVCALLFSAFVIASVGFQTPFGMSVKHLIGLVPMGDKTLHFLLLTSLSFLINASLKSRRTGVAGLNVLLGSLLVGTLFTLEEFSQAFIPSRNFEILDMVCNYAGVYTGSLLLFFFPSLTTSNDHDHRRTSISI